MLCSKCNMELKVDSIKQKTYIRRTDGVESTYVKVVLLCGCTRWSGSLMPWAKY